MAKKAAAVVVVWVVLSLVAACAPAAPTPTPTLEPTATPAEVLATKVEHLAGLWFDGASYIRVEADGTWRAAQSIDGLDNPDWIMAGRYRFEDGVCCEENPMCMANIVWEAYLRIEEGRAVRARFTAIEEPEPPCGDVRRGTERILVRVD